MNKVINEVTTKNTRNTRSESSGQSPDGRPDNADLPKEIGGRREGLEPTRYGDWEKKGRCIDF